MGIFEKEIKENANEILKNLDFKVLKINIEYKKPLSASVLLKDKNSNFKCWFDIWEDLEELTGDWNKYIFNLHNEDDLLTKYIQEDCNAFENAFFTSTNALQEKMEA